MYEPNSVESFNLGKITHSFLCCWINQNPALTTSRSMIGALDHAQHKSLSELYVNDDDIRTNIRMISALSIVSIADIIQAFDALCNHAGNENKLYLITLRRII